MKVTRDVKESVMLVFYILFRMNMLTRRQIKNMLEIMQEKEPKDIEEFFVEELKKIQPIRR